MGSITAAQAAWNAVYQRKRIIYHSINKLRHHCCYDNTDTLGFIALHFT
jgi:hypothetical protein